MVANGDDGQAVERVAFAMAAEVVPCLVAAFWDYPETCHLLPGERARRRALPRFLLGDARSAAAFDGLEAVRVDGTIAGAAASLPPAGYPVPARHQVREAVGLVPSAPWAVGALREALRGRAANRDAHQGHPPHHWLRAIGVHPDHHGSGIGSRLVTSLLARADRAGAGSFLFTATAANAAWYESFGFTVESRYRPTATWPDVWAMWRDPPRP